MPYISRYSVSSRNTLINQLQLCIQYPHCNIILCLYKICCLVLNWSLFQNWEGWNKPGVKAPFNKEEGSHLRAALLSGPPGVGKTTSATVCSKVGGFCCVSNSVALSRHMFCDSDGIRCTDIFEFSRALILRSPKLRTYVTCVRTFVHYVHWIDTIIILIA